MCWALAGFTIFQYTVLEEWRSFRNGNRVTEGWARVCGFKEGQKLRVIRARIRTVVSVSPLDYEQHSDLVYYVCMYV